MSNPWLRLYVEILDDPKVQRLTPAQFKLWINLICVAGRCAGSLPPLADIAFMLRIDEAALAGEVTSLVTAGLLEQTAPPPSQLGWSPVQVRHLDRACSQAPQ